jgi:hypothetical protein
VLHDVLAAYLKDYRTTHRRPTGPAAVPWAEVSALPLNGGGEPTKGRWPKAFGREFAVPNGVPTVTDIRPLRHPYATARDKKNPSGRLRFPEGLAPALTIKSQVLYLLS